MSESNKTHRCPLGGHCCNGEGEVFWLQDFSKLFCSLSPIPYGNLGSGERLNALTRFVVYTTVIMAIIGFQYTKTFFAVGMLFIFILFYLHNTNSDKEKFQILSDNIINNMNFPIDILNNNKQINSMPRAESLSFKNQMAKLPTMTANITNNYRGNTEQILKANRLDFSSGRRDSEADIKYYTTKPGVNRKTMIAPVIAPRILDQDVWGQDRIVRDGINNQYMLDLTTSDLDQGQVLGEAPFDRRGLATPIHYETRAPNAVTPLNNINDKLNIARYGAQEIWYGNENRRDFEKNIMPIYKNFYNKINTNIINTDSDKMNYDYGMQFSATSDTPSEAVVIPKPPAAATPATQPVKEKFGFVDLNSPAKANPGSYGSYTPFNAAQTVNQNFGNMGQTQVLDSTYNKFERNSTPIKDVVKEQLLGEDSTYVYTDEYFNQPASRLYLQDIQPKLYSYSVDQTPLNSNIGITYNPQRPPRFLDQVVDSNTARRGDERGLTYPVMSRIDPQLIRDDGTPGQIYMNPVRSEWSAKYSDYEPPEGSINFEDIYDPRFTNYGDPYRGYSDVNLGFVRYYYSDVDAYRQPNFIQRSNVDFIEYTNPQGQVWPYYNRTASIDDVRANVESQTTADEVYHREDMMENLMTRMNRGSWQNRYAPLSRAAHSNMGFGPSS